MISTKFGFPTENGAYLQSGDYNYKLLQIITKIFRLRLYDELFPKYDTWSKTITDYVGEIVRLDNVVTTGEKRIPLIADKVKTVVIILDDENKLTDIDFIKTLISNRAKQTAKEIRYENLCLKGWERFVSGTVCELIKREYDGLPQINIQCYYGIELRT